MIILLVISPQGGSLSCSKVLRNATEWIASNLLVICLNAKLWLLECMHQVGLLLVESISSRSWGYRLKVN